MLFAETLCQVMFGLGLEAVTLHSRVSLLPSTTVLSRGYVVCNDGESERRQRLLVSSVTDMSLRYQLEKRVHRLEYI